jgi:hypothetical protein
MDDFSIPGSPNFFGLAPSPLNYPDVRYNYCVVVVVVDVVVIVIVIVDVIVDVDVDVDVVVVVDDVDGDGDVDVMANWIQKFEEKKCIIFS